MKVCDLIEKLKTLPPDLPVITYGFDNTGAKDIDMVEVTDAIGVEDRGSIGPYERVSQLRTTGPYATKTNGASFKAVWIE